MGTATTRFQKAHSIEDAVRAMFLEEPGLSVDTVARRLAEKYRHHGLVKSQISRIRLEVRLAIDKATSVTAPPSLRRRLEFVQNHPPFNPPHWGSTKTDHDQKKEPVEPVMTPPFQLPPPPQMKLFPENTHRERIAYLEEYVLANPSATIAIARKALKDRFGVAVGTKAISEALATVRGYAKPQQTDLPLEHPQATAISKIVKAMNELGLKQIRIGDGGKWEANG